MKLYIGGAHEGQEALARIENPDAELLTDLHERLREVLEAGEDAAAWTRTWMDAHPNGVVVSDEVGCGIVPLLKEQRVWREAVGRALCEIAAGSESVTRVICGIGVRIK